jgi:hypothetical protein
MLLIPPIHFRVASRLRYARNRMKWFRSYHGAPMDPKWPVVAKRANVTISDVAAVWWCLMDHASQQEDRGSIEGFDAEIVGAFFNLDTSAIQAVMSALEQKGCLNGKRVSNWDEYQFDETSTPRVKRFRNGRKRRETKRNGEASVSESESGSSSESGKEVSPFDQFWQAYPRRQGKGQAVRAFKAALGKTDLQTILAGIERYKKHKPDYADWAMPATWLNGERWLDEATPTGVSLKPPVPKFGPKPTAFTDKDATWKPRIEMWTKTKTWLTSWGPKPGEPHCEVPRHLLAGESAA